MGLAEHSVANKYARVAADHNVVGVLRANKSRLLVGEVFGNALERKALVDAFVDIGGYDFEILGNELEQLLSARLGRGEYEHKISPFLSSETILHRFGKKVNKNH